MKRFLVILMSLFMVFAFSGCDLFTSDTAELLSPPSPTGELNFIAEAIKTSVEGDYTFKYPSRGSYRSAVVQEDINGDGILEAFAFYSMTDGETATMHINAISFKDNKWKSVAQQKIVAGGVDKIEFCDLDDDGIKEILVGWQVYGTSEMQLAVYSPTENALVQRMLQRYTHFITCDLNENDQSEVFIIKSGSMENANTAAVYELTEEGVNNVSSCLLDSSSMTFNEPVLDELSTGRPAVYIDEVKGVGAITEVLFFEKDELVNPLLQVETGETTSTLRSAIYGIRDINGDGIIEIPVQENVPSVASSVINEKLYLTTWCSFNGEKLVSQKTMMININDGYAFVIPPKWVGNIAILKDTENHIRDVYRYNPEDMTVGESLFYIKAVPKKDWDAGKYKANGIDEIVNNGETSFICRISSTALQEGITLEEVKASFSCYEVD